MPLAIKPDAEIDPQVSLVATARKPFSIVATTVVAAILLTSPGCIALSIPSKRFHDPQDRGGLLGDFRGGGSHSKTGHAHHGVHFMGDSAHSQSCTENGCVDTCRNGSHYDDFDEEAEFESGGRHQKAAEVPWPRYHPVPTRPVFSGYPGLPTVESIAEH